MAAENRVKIVLRCSECKQRNYNTTKNKKNTSNKLELKKYSKPLPLFFRPAGKILMVIRFTGR